MKYLSKFNKDLFAAIEYYRAIDDALARRFVESVEKAKEQIVHFPKTGRQMATYRRLALKAFPFWFCYRENLDGELVALVLFHHKQTAPEVK